MESGPLMFYSKTWVAEGPGRWRRLVASSAGEKWLQGSGRVHKMMDTLDTSKLAIYD